jgi:ribonuclease P protein component
MLPKRYRLRHRLDVQRVRRRGKIWRHPLAILLALPAEQAVNQMDGAADHNRLSETRFAFVASRRVGHAVVRNRAKRVLRAAVQANLGKLEPGWDCVFVAREETPGASYQEVESSVRQLLSRAQILAPGNCSDGGQGV